MLNGIAKGVSKVARIDKRIFWREGRRAICTGFSRQIVAEERIEGQYASSMLRYRDEDRLDAISWDLRAMAGPMEA